MRFFYLSILFFKIISVVLCDEYDIGKIAFLYLTRGYMPLADIWDEFFRWHGHPQHYALYVHPHKNVEYRIDSIFYKREIPGHDDIKWNDISQILAMKRLVAEALKDPDNNWFALMSESCVPLHPLSLWREAIYNTNKSVVNACPNLSEQDSDIKLRWNQDLEAVGFNRSHWRKSSQWFLLSRKHAQLFVDDNRLVFGFNKTYANDEHYLPMLISYYGLEAETTCSGDFVTASFVPGEPHPITYSGDKVDTTLIQKLQGPRDGFCSNAVGICHFTARKFTPSAKRPLLELLPYLLHAHGSHSEYSRNPFWHDQKRLRKTDSSHPTYYIKDHEYLRRIPDVNTVKAMHLDPAKATPLGPVERKKLEQSGLSQFNPFLSRKDGRVYRLDSSAKNTNAFGYTNKLFYILGGTKRIIKSRKNISVDEMLRLLKQNKIRVSEVHSPLQLDEIRMGDPIDIDTVLKL